MNTVEANSMLHSLARLWELCPEMRLGQLMATLELLVQDATEHSLWDVEDAELLAAIERFREDLHRRGQSQA